jgi:hypothetical protein
MRVYGVCSLSRFAGGKFWAEASCLYPLVMVPAEFLRSAYSPRFSRAPVHGPKCRSIDEWAGPPAPFGRKARPPVLPVSLSGARLRRASGPVSSRRKPKRTERAMAAWVVTKHHIDVLVSAAVERGIVIKLAKSARLVPSSMRTQHSSAGCCGARISPQLSTVIACAAPRRPSNIYAISFATPTQDFGLRRLRKRFDAPTAGKMDAFSPLMVICCNCWERRLALVT